MYPNEDVTPNEWQTTGCTIKYDCIDEDKGSTPDGKYIRAHKNESNDEERYGMPTHPNIRKCSSLKVYAYGCTVSSDCGLYWWSGDTRVWFNGGWLSNKSLTFPCENYEDGITTWGWDNVEWTGLTGYQDDINDLLLSIIAPSGMGTLDSVWVENAYIQATVEFHNDRLINRRINTGINGAIN